MKNFMKYSLIILITVLFISCGSCKSQSKETTDEDYNINYNDYIKKTGKPQNFNQDLVPDEKTAILIADIIWNARFEGLKWSKEIPYTVILEDKKIWYVKTNLPKNYIGKILHIKINKYDGRILYIWIEG